jgi:hypothetical protein
MRAKLDSGGAKIRFLEGSVAKCRHFATDPSAAIESLPRLKRRQRQSHPDAAAAVF